MTDRLSCRASPAGSRALDIVLACVGLLLAGPLMLVIALAILVESGRPIFYAQTRLGQGGQHFRLYKFRKFKPSASEAGRPLTVQGDDRLSRIGRFLASSKLDELPQFYNVLKGDMSIVGPRPESLAFADCFSGETMAVLDYRPGIFGPSQIAFRDEGALYPPGAEPTQVYREVLFPTKARIDLAYYAHRTLLTDCTVIARSVVAVVGIDRMLGARNVDPAPPTASLGLSWQAAGGVHAMASGAASRSEGRG
ncbi:sugar transferase [Falsiroseomonas sp. HW251]|uniref:sugar transferase n=1 Tax=Falsiroseomonas sp. HW251 TaxID=3390998 RepID=UPI003D3203E8